MKKLKLNIIIIVLALNSTILCQWSNDPFANTRVSYWGVNPGTTADGNGGAFISFNNFSYDSSFSYLQKINYDGTIKWPTPIHVSYEGSSQFTGGIFPSDNNNIILGYIAGIIIRDSLGHEYDHSDPYVQKFDNEGNKLFGSVGVKLRTDTTRFSLYPSEFISDNSGGIFSFWSFVTPGGGTYAEKLYMQHISKTGKRLWGDNGILVADSIFDAFGMKILSDDNGGIFLMYNKNRGEFYLENYDSSGSFKWRIIDGWIWDKCRWIKDGEGGIILSTVKLDYPYNNKLFLHRISNTGERLWGENGVVMDDSMTNINPEAASVLLNSDSTITALWDNGWYPLDDIFVQRFDLWGNRLWNNNILVSDVISSKADIGLLESGMNSNILIWDDLRTPKGFYAQRIDKYGTKLWGDSDRAITNQSPGTTAFISDNNYGAIVVWADGEPWNGILAQQISKNGNLGEVLTSVNDDNHINSPDNFNLFQNYPNPFNPNTKISWQSPVNGLQILKLYDVLGREIATLINEYRPAGKYEVNWNATNLPSGVYFYRLQVKDPETSSGQGFAETRKMLLLK